MVDAVSGPMPVRFDLTPPPTVPQAVNAGVAPTPPAPSQDGGGQTLQDPSADSGQSAGPSGGQNASTSSDPTRVVVEQGQNKFVLVLKVLSNATGDVLAEIPNPSPQDVGANPNYQAGALINQQV